MSKKPWQMTWKDFCLHIDKAIQKVQDMEKTYGMDSKPTESASRALGQKVIGERIPLGTISPFALYEWAIKKAMREGQEIPEKVLVEYQELLRQRGRTEPAVKPTTTKSWDVTLRQKMKVGTRKVAEDVDRTFSVQAKTSASARKAVQDAGHKGEIVSVEPVKPTTGKPTAKEPWEMTLNDHLLRTEVVGWDRDLPSFKKKHLARQDEIDLWMEMGGGAPQSGYFGPAFRNHKKVIREAIREGKPVPAEVLKDYPDLAKAKPRPSVIERAEAHIKARGETVDQVLWKELTDEAIARGVIKVEDIRPKAAHREPIYLAYVRAHWIDLINRIKAKSQKAGK